MPPKRRQGREAQVANNATAGSRRQLNRRDTYDAAERLLDAHLQMRKCSDEDRLHKRNEDGESMNSMCQRWVKEIRKRNGRTRTKFWEEFDEQFRIGSAGVESAEVEDASEAEEDIDEEMTKRLDKMLSDNPVGRKIAPVLAWMQVVPTLTVASLNILMRSIAVSAKVTKKQSNQLHIGCLHMLVRSLTHLLL